MSKSGLKDPGSIQEAVNCASSARTAPANTRRVPAPPGPKPEGWKLNGVPAPKERGTSR